MSRRLTAVFQRLILAAILSTLLVTMGPLGAAPHASAAGDWHVNPGESIQTAIDAASAAGGGTVHVAAGTYHERITLKNLVRVLGAGATITTLNGDTDGDAIGDGPVVSALDLDSTAMLVGVTVTDGDCGMNNSNSCPTVTDCTFSGNFVDGSMGYGMYNSGSCPIVTGCTFSGNGGAFVAGGGMYNSGSSPIVTGCTFSGNYSFGTGGGMYNASGSSPQVTNCTFSENEGKRGGGGMWNSDSSPEVNNCIFSGNYIAYAGNGGGIGNSNSSPIVTGCTFAGNSAEGYGGGMCNSSGSSPILTNCTFSGNWAYLGAGMWNADSCPVLTDCAFFGHSSDMTTGGGMYNGNSSPVLNRCIFSNNSDGGGMWNVDSSPVLTDCVFSGNSAWEGGGMYNSASSPVLANCIFSGNSAGGGGGMHNGSGSSPQITNCTFFENSADYHDETWGYGGGGAIRNSSASPTLTNCILWGGYPEEIYDEASYPDVTYCDVAGGYPGTGNIGQDPLLTADLHLLAGSPCIDTGDSSAPWLPDTDFDGQPRICDGDHDGNAVVDMGADEMLCASPTLVPLLLAPTNGQYIGDTTPTLDWTDVYDPAGVTYETQVDDDDDFSSAMVEHVGLTASACTLAAGESLSDGLYYWRVRTVDAAGNAGVWTAAWCFKVDTAAPPASRLVTPRDGRHTRDNAPALGWIAVSDPSGVHYQVQVDDDSSFSSPAIYKTWLNNPCYTPATEESLSDGIYYWRVRAVDSAANAGAWTAPWSFTVDTVAPAVPILLSPINGAHATDSTPTLDWSDVTDSSAVHYNLQVDDNADFSSPELNWGWLNSSACTVPSVLAEGVHYWRVMAEDAAMNTSAWTAPWSFMVDTAAPAVPILLSPINGAHTTDSTPTLDWSDVTDSSAVHYQLQVDDNADFSSPELNWAWLEGSVYTVPWGLADGVHYWRVRAVDDAMSTSAWTSSWSFTVSVAALPAPHMFYPPNGACIRDCTPYLDWSYITDPSGVHYQLQVDNNADFSSPVINRTWVSISAYTVPTALWNGTFYWRVRAVNGMGGVSDWTIARRFTVDTQAPSTPYLLYPGRWAVTSDHTPYLDWSWVSDPSGVHYQLQVAGNVSFYSPRINRTWLPYSSYTVITWLPRGVYYWRVRAVDGAGNASAWTTARPFVVR